MLQIHKSDLQCLIAQAYDYPSKINLIKIILFMSLLTSSATTREQHRFFNKMERQFNKRTFVNTNYSEPKHPLQLENQNNSKIEQHIRDHIDEFLAGLKKILTQASNTKIDYYYILNEMKSLDFFNEVADLIQESLIQKNNQLLKENQKTKQELKKTRQQLRQLQRSEPKVQQPNHHFKLNASKSIAQNLYDKSKTLSEAQFVELCNKVMLGEKLVIKKMAHSESYRKWDELKVDKMEEKDMFKRVDAYFEKKLKSNVSEGEKELKQLITDLREFSTQKQRLKGCMRPCCNTTEQTIKNESKAFKLRNSYDVKRPSQVYKNDKSEEYFNRYYRKSEFDMHKVYSVEKTKLEEMEKIEDQYRIASKLRKKVNYSEFK